MKTTINLMCVIPLFVKTSQICNIVICKYFKIKMKINKAILEQVYMSGSLGSDIPVFDICVKPFTELYFCL